MFIKSIKTIACLNCGSTLARTNNCLECKSKKTHLFDSKAEARRFTFLKQKTNTTDIITQYPFPIYVPEMKLSGSFTNPLPTQFIPSKKYMHVMDYKIDFYYFDSNNQKGCVFEEFKESKYCKKTKKYKPLITVDASIKLRLLANSVGPAYDVIVSYPDPQNTLGYSTKIIKPKADQ